jgi:hypothetical protein
MLLKEFFSKPIEIDQNQKKKDQPNAKLDDELFWYIIDHDKLHKDYFFPIAKKLKTLKECGPEMVLELFMPMVVKGCKEFYADKKMTGKLGKVFSKELREEICKRLYDHYNDDVNKSKYRLG